MDVLGIPATNYNESVTEITWNQLLNELNMCREDAFPSQCMLTCQTSSSRSQMNRTQKIVNNMFILCDMAHHITNTVKDTGPVIPNP